MSLSAAIARARVIPHPMLAAPVRAPQFMPHEAQAAREACFLEMYEAKRSPSLKVKQIVAIVAQHYGVTAADIMSYRRPAHIVRPRQVAMYLAYQLTGYTMAKIGHVMCGRDHTTILWGVRETTRKRGMDAILAADIRAIQTSLGCQ